MKIASISRQNTLNLSNLTALISAVIRISAWFPSRKHFCFSSNPQLKYRMPREIGPSLNERQFFQKALEENLRLDGRGFDQFRSLELDFGEVYGVADVKLGKTRSVLSSTLLSLRHSIPLYLFKLPSYILTESSPISPPK